MGTSVSKPLAVGFGSGGATRPGSATSGSIATIRTGSGAFGSGSGSQPASRIEPEVVAHADEDGMVGVALAWLGVGSRGSRSRRPRKITFTVHVCGAGVYTRPLLRSSSALCMGWGVRVGVV
jgi:hypothetical protein